MLLSMLNNIDFERVHVKPKQNSDSKGKYNQAEHTPFRQIIELFVLFAMDR